MSATEGVPAFPMSVGIGPAGDVFTSDDFKGGAGMTLRDYFAAKAMIALLPICSDDSRAEGLAYPEHVAAVSYGMADAMLKAREA